METLVEIAWGIGGIAAGVALIFVFYGLLDIIENRQSRP